MNLEQLILRNGAVTEFRGPLGLRNRAVYCASRDLRQVEFANSTDVRRVLDICLRQTQKNFSSARTIEEVAEASSIFWMSFIAIHPFMDGNRRTAESVLLDLLSKWDLTIPSFDLVRKYLIEGQVEADLHNLKMIFLASFSSLGACEEKI